MVVITFTLVKYFRIKTYIQLVQDKDFLISLLRDGTNLARPNIHNRYRKIYFVDILVINICSEQILNLVSITYILTNSLY